MDDVDKLSCAVSAAATAPPARTFCALAPGDILNGNIIRRRLGSGREACVWEAETAAGQPVAIKVCRRNDDKYYTNEVKILNRLLGISIQTGVKHPNIVGYLGIFTHICLDQDLSPCIYPCIMFNLYGDTLSELIKFCKKTHDTGVPAHVVKKIARQLLDGLAHLHANNIIHTDIKPANILMNTTMAGVTDENIHIVIADVGTSSSPENIFSETVGTAQYISPELIIEAPFSFPTDIWSAFATIYGLYTGDYLFDVFDECESTYGEDIDDVMVCDTSNGTSGDITNTSSSSSENEETEFKTNYRHLLLIAKVIGYPPRSFRRKASKYYNRKGQLRNHPNISLISICDLISMNYTISAEECSQLAEFLNMGLRYLPADRITARAALEHPWLREDAKIPKKKLKKPNRFIRK